LRLKVPPDTVPPPSKLPLPPGAPGKLTVNARVPLIGKVPVSPKSARMVVSRFPVLFALTGIEKKMEVGPVPPSAPRGDVAASEPAIRVEFAPVTVPGVPGGVGLFKLPPAPVTAVTAVPLLFAPKP